MRRRVVPLVAGVVIVLAVVLVAALVGTSGRRTGTAADPTATRPGTASGVEFLGEQRLPPGTEYAGTTVGGLSGLDRDPSTGTWFLISDDRSAKQPARYYTADLAFDGPDGGLSAIRLTGVTTLLRPDGAPYPPVSGGDGTTVDPEDIRVDPRSTNLLWSQEGERSVPADGAAPTLIDPSVRFTDREGRSAGEVPVPPEERVSAADRGIRQNLGPEGLSFADHGRLVVTAVEGPLWQDGPTPTRTAGARSRIVVQRRDGTVVARYAYPQDPLFADPVPGGGTAVTGVTGILAVDDADPTRFLVLERSFVPGPGNRVRVYEIDTAGATDLTSPGTPVDAARPVAKRLLVDLADLPLRSVDNVEGLAWGPPRSDGSRTLVLVSDDNFSPDQVTQLVALAVP
jgi:hypothetical protein